MRLAFREALLAFRRAPLLSALSVTTIAFSLFAFALFGLVALNIRHALQQVEERVEIRAFVADRTPSDAVAAAMGDIGGMDEVARVIYVTPAQALQRARRELGEFSDVFEGEFLPGSIELQLKPDYRDPTTVEAVAKRIAAYDFVEDVRYGEEWVEKLYRLRTISTFAGVSLGIAFAVVAIIIIGATIRMAVLARGPEIAIMRLVGATDTFIRLPFLIEGFAKGIMGGVLALVLTWVTNALVNEYFIETTFFTGPVVALGVLGGALLGFLGSAMSVGRHLRMAGRERRARAQ